MIATAILALTCCLAADEPLAGFPVFVPVAAGDTEALAALRGEPLLIDGLVTAPGLKVDPEWFARARDAYLRTRNPGLLARSDCFRRRAVHDALERDAAEAAALKEFAPRGLLLVTDPSLTRDGDPFDLCRCEACGAGEQAAWTIDEVRARNERKTGAAVDLSGWVARATELDRAFTLELAALCRIARDASGAPAGFAGGGSPNPFTGLDWPLAARAIPLLVPPDDPVTRDLVRSFAPQGALVLATSHPFGGRERAARHSLWRQALLGARGLLLDADDADMLDALAPVLHDLRSRVVPLLGAARPDDGGIGILFSPASARVRWLIETEEDGIHWIARTRSTQREALAATRELAGWQALLEDAGHGYRFVSDAELDEEAEPLEGLRVLVLPDVIALSDRAAARIRTFAAAGGLVLASGATAWFDERGRGRDAGALDGVVSSVTPVLPMPDRSWDLPAEATGPAIADYWLLRFRGPDTAATLREGVVDALAAHGIEPAARVHTLDGARARFVQVLRYRTERGATVLAFRRNAPPPEIPGSLLSEEDALPQELIATLADGRELAFTLAMDDVALFELD